MALSGIRQRYQATSSSHHRDHRRSTCLCVFAVNGLYKLSHHRCLRAYGESISAASKQCGKTGSLWCLSHIWDYAGMVARLRGFLCTTVEAPHLLNQPVPEFLCGLEGRICLKCGSDGLFWMCWTRSGAIWKPESVVIRGPAVAERIMGLGSGLGSWN